MIAAVDLRKQALLEFTQADKVITISQVQRAA